MLLQKMCVTGKAAAVENVSSKKAAVALECSRKNRQENKYHNKIN